MFVPYPYDAIGAWLSKHNLDLSTEAYNDLAELLTEAGDISVDGANPADMEIINNL
jgi:hypothetical protein